MTTSLLVVLAIDATQETLQEILRIDMTALGREERGIYHIANTAMLVGLRRRLQSVRN